MMDRLKSIKRMVALSLFLIVTAPAVSWADDYIQVAGLIDTRTTFSDGELSIHELARLAQKRGFEVLVVNDHDRMVMEYGLFPLRRMLKKRVEINSINKQGAENYLKAIKRVDHTYPGMILIP